MPDNDLLLTALQAAVPLEIDRARDLTPEHREDVAGSAVDILTAHGDDLLYGGPQCARAFNALTRALGCLACQPGGVTWAGQHWCTRLHCPGLEAHLDEDHPEPEPPAQRRPVETVLSSLLTGGPDER